MNAWNEYKKKLGTTRPWDIVRPSIDKVTEEEANQRFAICEDCDRLLSVTKQCKECGCIMPIKVKLKLATCPLEKW